VFGPGRAALLAATDTAAAVARDEQAAALAARLRRIETSQNSCILQLEELPADPAGSAAAAMRGRIRARFAQLHADRDATLKALPGILDPGRDGYDDTADGNPGDPGSVEHLFEPVSGQ